MGTWKLVLPLLASIIVVAGCARASRSQAIVEEPVSRDSAGATKRKEQLKVQLSLCEKAVGSARAANNADEWWSAVEYAEEAMKTCGPFPVGIAKVRMSLRSHLVGCSFLMLSCTPSSFPGIC
jgi:hypothetical protein